MVFREMGNVFRKSQGCVFQFRINQIDFSVRLIGFYFAKINHYHLHRCGFNFVKNYPISSSACLVSKYNLNNQSMVLFVEAKTKQGHFAQDFMLVRI